MKPVAFKHQNIVFAKDQPEYQQLPALKFDDPTGEVVSCWELSFKERLRVLIFGRVWLSLRCFNKPLTPSFLAVDRKEIYQHPDDLVVWYKKILLAIRPKLKLKRAQ